MKQFENGLGSVLYNPRCRFFPGCFAFLGSFGALLCACFLEAHRDLQSRANQKEVWALWGRTLFLDQKYLLLFLRFSDITLSRGPADLACCLSWSFSTPVWPVRQSNFHKQSMACGGIGAIWFEERRPQTATRFSLFVFSCDVDPLSPRSLHGNATIHTTILMLSRSIRS